MSFNDFDDNPIWNEFQWESHLDEIEKKSENLRRFITSDLNGNTPRWITLLRENVDELDAVEAFIEEEMLLDEAYFPEDEDDWEDDDDEFDDDFFLEDNPLFNLDELEDEELEDFDYGEEWKELSEEYTFSDYGSIENLTVYSSARLYAADVLKWAESIPSHLQTRQVHEFITNVLKISAKLAGGYSFGFEQDVMGGNIAYTKKALYSANDALSYLTKMKKEPFIIPSLFTKLHERLFEIRNDIGIYVQELRDQFQKGFE
jgi:hypothetical protein